MYCVIKVAEAKTPLAHFFRTTAELNVPQTEWRRKIGHKKTVLHIRKRRVLLGIFGYALNKKHLKPGAVLCVPGTKPEAYPIALFIHQFCRVFDYIFFI